MRTRWIPILLMAATTVPQRAQSESPDHFVLTAPQVAQALSIDGLPAAGEQVSLLTKVVATDPSPLLDILSTESLANSVQAGHATARVRVKLACHVPGTCLPFYAIVSRPQSTAGLITIGPGASPATAGSKPKNDITMPAGTHALLVMDDQRSHIQVVVVSLESGKTGSRIRVASPDGKRTYVGEVVGPTLLRGSF
jgi:hypothetical protein